MTTTTVEQDIVKALAAIHQILEDMDKRIETLESKTRNNEGRISEMSGEWG